MTASRITKTGKDETKVIISKGRGQLSTDAASIAGRTPEFSAAAEVVASVVRGMWSAHKAPLDGWDVESTVHVESIPAADGSPVMDRAVTASHPWILAIETGHSSWAGLPGGKGGAPVWVDGLYIMRRAAAMFR